MNNINHQFTLISSIVLTVVGFIGNSITIMIVARPEMRNISMFRYLLASMVNDCLVLMTMWLFNFPEIFINDSISCKWNTYLEYLNFNYSGWIVVVSLADRFITVKYPNKFLFRNQFKFQALVLLLIFFILVMLNIPFYAFYDYYSSSNKTICRTNERETEFYVQLSSALIGVIMPFFLMIIFSFLIGRCLLKKSRNIQNRKDFKKEIRLIKLMLSISAFFLICNLPFFIQQLTHDWFFFTYVSEPFVSDDTFNFIFNITNQLTFVYNSFGFFVCLFSNNVFRNYFFSKFSFHQAQVYPLISST